MATATNFQSSLDPSVLSPALDPEPCRLWESPQDKGLTSPLPRTTEVTAAAGVRRGLRRAPGVAAEMSPKWLVLQTEQMGVPGDRAAEAEAWT